jgi:2-polyprenyl-3-methyl-5-hydroxy-6-metoxy-1,4-benzoquinol methylase
MEISTTEYWNNLHRSSKPNIEATTKSYWMRKLGKFLSRYLKPDSKKKLVDVGGAPGVYALLFYKLFRYRPYVIDYSEPGIETTRQNFERFQIPVSNAIIMDFLKEKRLSTYQDYFDVVFSTGLLEHFKDPSHVLHLHLKMLRGSGDLIVMIPAHNMILRLQPLLFKEATKQYDASFMNIERFAQVFTGNREIIIKYLGYFGGIGLGVLRSENRIVRTLIFGIQRFLEITGIESIIPENRFTSPYIICVAKKKSNG